MKYLLINRCDDSALWYYSLVGTLVPFDGACLVPEAYGFRSRDSSGQERIVKFDDAEMVVMTGGKSASLYSRE